MFFVQRPGPESDANEINVDKLVNRAIEVSVELY
jgi:hypothetical protein